MTRAILLFTAMISRKVRSMPAPATSLIPPCPGKAGKLRALALLLGSLAPLSSHAFVVGITAGTKSIYLQVGAGSMTGTRFNAGGTPSNNATINNVTVTVPPANLGGGPLPMTTDSTVTASPYDGFTFCSVPSQVYIGGFFRTPGASANATLSAQADSALVNAGGQTIPFNSVSWVSGGNGDATATIPSGTFVGGAAQTLLGVTQNTWFESCLQFNYANAQLVPAGTFKGRVKYTLTAP
ncbi:MAG: hypothetical protein B7X59_02510 [Polaromonas sp. 39-63-203]|jgi:hypothetical protein|nr:MAG: hypothetical protein B7Y42_03340 [Polaromonas sp. 28-63-22]OYZ84736.1 MAG: hypothetical protein B7Y03_02255 [Polaromonas sp. 24-62-144]OZB00519.1 MAG: hypothetical protein B7X59_02510 [Polaromonas sp. 39-63-203]